MKQFKDAVGRDWRVDVNIGSIKAVRQILKVDLWALFGDEARRVLSDPPLLVDVLYVLCKQQCDDRKMSDVDFGQMFQNDVLEAAGEALVGAVIDFFPTSRQTILNATVEKSREIAPQLAARAIGAINNLTVTDFLTPSQSPASLTLTHGP